MKEDDFYELGIVSKTHGIKGAVVVRMDVDNPQRYRQLKEVWFESEHRFTKYHIEEISIQRSEAIIKVSEINSSESALPLIGKPALLPLSMLPPLDGKRFYLHEIRGFHIVDERQGNIGTIEAVFNLPQHPIASIRVNERELLIPLACDFIIEIDRNRKIIRMNLPEGITEI